MNFSKLIQNFIEKKYPGVVIKCEIILKSIVHL